MEPARFDVWLYAIGPVAGEPAAIALSRVFGISELVAQQLIAALPRIVTHDATLERSDRIVNALTAIGGRCAAVQRPLRPMPVLIIGTSSGHADETADSDAALPKPHDTLTLGTPFVPATTPRIFAEPSTTQSIPSTAATVIDGTPSHTQPADDPQRTAREVRPDSGSAQAHVAIRRPSWTVDALPSAGALQIAGTAGSAVQASAWPSAQLATFDLVTPASSTPEHETVTKPLEEPTVLDPQMDAALPVTRNLQEWNEALTSHRPAAVSLRAPDALALALEAEAENDTSKRLALPAADAPIPSRSRMRSASQRAGAPQRLGRRSTAPPPRLESPTRLDPVAALFKIQRQAQQSSWRNALHGHPVTGFLLVLGGTSAAFLLVYAAYWAVYIR